MNTPHTLENPFPGLRPFGPEETHLFFGREDIVDQLLIRLRETRFLCVTGDSGCGKSSLVRAGLIPSLHSGFMTAAGSSWRVAVMRPGTDPIGNLANALNDPEVLGEQAAVQDTSPVLTEITLRRSNVGLVECVRLSRLPPEDNLLIVVDQFEELFRYKRSGGSDEAREDAIAFVKRLLAAIDQTEVPIYVVLTVRSEYVGQCNEYPGLPEAVNVGQFLVPRMTREQLRSAIAGPVLVAGAELTPRLLVRLLNDVGDHPDRLPMLQHAMLRTWNRWRDEADQARAIDIEDYEAVGTLAHALSDHANETFAALPNDRSRAIAATVFKALTDITSDSRGVRRPVSAEQLCLLADATLEELTEAIDEFREPERSFLMPPLPVPIQLDTTIDITHESLMRVWDQLIEWTREESQSAQIYKRLAASATRYEEGQTGLWRDPDLEIALNWREATQPTEAWAGRYDPAFRRAMSFLEKSAQERRRQAEERQRAHRKRLQIAWGVSLVLLVFALFAFQQERRAVREQLRAEQNYQLAVRAVDDMLTDVAVEESLADLPQTEQLRQNLLEKARLYFETLEGDEAAGAALRFRRASAQVRLGRIYSLQGQPDQSESAYLMAIDQLTGLHEEFDNEPLYQLHLSTAYNDFGEELRSYNAERAEAANSSALELQKNLVDRFPEVADYRYELGRTYNNRGILVGKLAMREPEAETSFREAIGLFETLRTARSNPQDTLRLARTRNNLAILLNDLGRNEEAISEYREAIGLMRELVEAQPKKRELREGLASIYNNLGNLLLTTSDFEPALQANSEARALLEDLAVPRRALRNEIANSNNTRGRILNSMGRTREAAEAYGTALQQFEQLERDTDYFRDDPDLNERIGNTLANLAILEAQQERFDVATDLVSRAVQYYKNAVQSPAASTRHSRSLANALWLLADTRLKAGNHAEAAAAAESLIEVMADDETLYDAAVLYSRAAGIVLSDRTLSAAERQALENSHAGRVLELLASAIAGGYPASRIKADANSRFEFIADRDDFRSLLNTAGEE